MDRPSQSSPVIELNGKTPPPELRGLPIRGPDFSGEIWAYAVSPDRKRIAFTTIQNNPDGFTIRLYCHSMGTRRVRELDQHEGNRAAEIVQWSPDSRRILFRRIVYPGASVNADGSPLFDVSADGGKPRHLTPNLWGEESSGIMYWPEAVAFSPDGTRLLLVQGYSRFRVENKRLVCHDYRSGKLLWMSEPHIAAIEPAWSPDGRRILYLATADPHRVEDSERILQREAQTHLWMRDADGRHPRKLTADPKFREEEPRWTAGGATIRFVRCDNADLGSRVPFRSRCSLWEVRPDGAGLRKLRDLPPDPPKD